MPDVVIWMMSGEKRIAYHRIPAYDLLYSTHVGARGKYCGKTLDLFMQVIFEQKLPCERFLMFRYHRRKEMNPFSNLTVPRKETV